MTNPIQEALQGWEEMKAQLGFSNDQVRELNNLNSKLMTEVDYLREQLAYVSSERDRYQRYTIEITTRLSTIKETILIAESGAREFALKPPIPKEKPQIPQEDVAEVERIVRNLPAASYT